MRRLLVLCAGLSLLAPPTVSRAIASVPSPVNSTFPSCIQVVPGGNFVTTIVVRDLIGNPIAGSVVELSYANCAGLAVCPNVPPLDPYTHDPVAKTITLSTNSSGIASFHLRAGGGCVNSGVDIRADNVFFGSARVVSADQNGDLVVNATDVALVTPKIGTADLSGDVNCDGVVNANDLSEVQSLSFGNACDNPTPTRPTSWGSLKILYR